MDPFAAIGLASNIISFVDYGTKIVNGAREIYDSASGMTEESQALDSIASKMKGLSSKLLPSTGSPRSEDEEALCRIAAECNIISDKILEHLSKIKPKDSRSRRDVFFAAAKNKFREKERLELEKRLASCRSQLDLQLNVLTSSDTKARITKLVSSSEEAKVGLEQLIEGLHRGVAVASIGSEAHKQLSELLELSEDTFQIVIQQRILNGLAFEGMYGRFEAVEDAHYKTFEWIFQASDNEKDKLRRSASELFKKWLSSEANIFHVAGKLGSGKSTLMKFLCEDERTKEELQKWAGDRKLVFASFFFWKPGTLLQKSLGGLYRSLLYEVLNSCPDLIPVVLPSQWKEVKSMPWQVQSHMQIPTKDIKAAFSRLMANTSLYQSYSFCYFIDGLDEYEETTSDDYKSLVEALSGWTRASPGSVKICVSSREYNVFLDGFSSERRLRLQDLTRADMELYVRDKLLDPGIEGFQRLINAIVEKGEGIFLWIALVVKALRERMGDGHGLRTLEKALDSLPRELENLLKHLLDTLDPLYKRRFYQLFAMILESQASNVDGCLSPLACSFLEDFDENPTFAMEPDFPNFNMEEKDRVAKIQLAQKHINGYCKGLLEFKTKAYEGNRLVFTHRSIPEFLETRGIRDDMDLCFGNFTSVEAISQLLLAEIRCSSPKSVPRKEMSLAMYRIVALRHKNKVNKPPYIFLDCLSSTITLHEMPESSEEINLAGLLQDSHSEAYAIGCDGGSYRYLTSPLHGSAFLEDFEYTKWKLKHNPEILHSDYQIAMIVVCASYVNNYSPMFEFLEFLLGEGLSPQALIHKTAATNSFSDQTEMTFWVHFILDVILSWPGFGEELETLAKHLRVLIECFLRFRADPRLMVWVAGNKNDDSLHVEYVGRHLKGPKSESDPNPGFSLEKCSAEAEKYFLKRKSAKLSLRDLIPLWHFENEAVILQLIDRNIEELEQKNRREMESGKKDETPAAESSSCSSSEITDKGLSEPEPNHSEEPPIVTDTKSWASGVWGSFGAWSKILAFVIVLVIAILAARPW